MHLKSSKDIKHPKCSGNVFFVTKLFACQLQLFARLQAEMAFSSQTERIIIDGRDKTCEEGDKTHQ